MRKVVLLFAVAFLLAGFAFYQYNSKDGEEVSLAAVNSEFKPKAGAEMVNFALPGLDESNVDTESEKGKMIFLNFWASWCGPCELEAPDLQALHEKYSDVMTMYGVNSTKNDKERAARQFVDNYKFTFPILFDRKGDITKLYKVNTFPTNFLIDGNGVIRERINGVITMEEWEKLIKKWM